MTAEKSKRPPLGARIIAGLEDAVAHAKGQKSGAVVHAPAHVDVRAIRLRTGLSQAAFARRWEIGRCEPAGPARVLLAVIDREREAVERALHTA